MTAIELRTGGIYAIECDHIVSAETFRNIREQLDREEARLGCKFVFLTKGMKIAQFQPDCVICGSGGPPYPHMIAGKVYCEAHCPGNVAAL